MYKDYYQILEIEPTASLEAIKKAYWRLAHKYHPDKNPDSDTAEKFRQLRRAYEVLSNPYKRKLYDNRISGIGPVDATTMRYEQVRKKRASRYRRTSYQRRFTYRGNHSNSVAQPPYTQTSTQEQAARAKRNARVSHEQFVARQNTQKAYAFFNVILKIILGGIFIYSASLIIDIALSRPIEEELVIRKRPLPWTLADPGMVKVRTENYTFKLNRAYAYKFFTNQYIQIKVSPFRNIVTHVFIQEPRISYYVKTGYSLNGFASLLVWILILSIPLLFVLKLYPEVAVYIGTAQILVFVMLIGMLSRG